LASNRCKFSESVGCCVLDDEDTDVRVVNRTPDRVSDGTDGGLKPATRKDDTEATEGRVLECAAELLVYCTLELIVAKNELGEEVKGLT